MSQGISPIIFAVMQALAPPPARSTNDPIKEIGAFPFVYIDIADNGLMFRGGSKEECDCIHSVMEQGKVVTREEFISVLKESGAVTE
jgi:hypothetical protein